MKNFFVSLITVCLFYSAYSQDMSETLITDTSIKSDFKISSLSIDSTRSIANSDSILLDEMVVTSSANSTSSVIGSYDPGASIIKQPTIISPSPNSESLIRVMSESVDLYTGRLNVGFPLYVLKSGNIQVPISINCNANAHKVNEIGSWVGMGMNLSAGGLITRVMKSLPDEMKGDNSETVINPTYFNFKGIGYIYLLPNANIDVRRFSEIVVPYANTYSTDQKKDIVNKGSWNMKQNQLSVGYDLQPDQFYFNFGGFSGEFVFDQNGKINTIPKSNLTIIPSFEIREGHNKLCSFTITTEDGYTYEFGNYNLNAVEESKLKVSLKKIAFTYKARELELNGVKVLMHDQTYSEYFNYEAIPYVLSHTAPISSSYSNSYLPDELDNFDWESNSEQQEYFSYSSTWYLTKITSPTNDEVIFNYTDNGTITYLADRSFSASVPDFQNVNASTSLSSRVPVYNSFLKSYFHPSQQYFNVEYSEIELKSKRLTKIYTPQNNSVTFEAINNREDFPGDKRLDKIIVKNNNEIIKQFLFDYEIKTDNSEIEKFRFNYSRPRYQYPSGGGSYLGLTPEVAFEDRIFDVPNYCRKRMFLQSITESDKDNVSIPPFIFKYYDDEVLPYRTSTEQDFFGFANSNSLRYPFAVSTYQHRFPYWDEQAPQYYPMVSLGSYILSFQVTNTFTQQGPYINNTYSANKDYNIAKLHAGVLKSVRYPTGGIKEFLYEFNGNSSCWSGLRIKEIKEYANEGILSNSHTYKYGTYINADEVIQTYGAPEFLSLHTDVGNNNIKLFFASNRVFFSSSRINPENLTKGAAGGYDYAEVCQTGNGKYKVEFTNALSQGFADIFSETRIISSRLEPNDQSTGLMMPFPPNNSFDWKRGLPLTETFISEGNIPIKTVIHKYDFEDPLQYSSSIHVSKYRIESATDWNWLLYGINVYVSSRVTEKSKETISYPDDVNKLSDVEEYGYKLYNTATTSVLLQNEIKHINGSKGQQTIMRIKYPYDYSTPSQITSQTDPFLSGIGKLKMKGIYSYPIESYSLVQDQDGNNKKIINGLVNQYHSELPVPVKVYSLQTPISGSSFIESISNGTTFNYDANYREIYNYNKYTNTGNILEIQKSNDLKEVYLWGYQGQYPVAKVVGSDFETVAACIDQAVLDNANGQYTESQIREELKKIRTTLYGSNALVTTYTYKPLIGVSSETDANDRTIFYTYDNFGRLTIITDKDGKIIKRICYNYSGQQEDCNNYSYSVPVYGNSFIAEYFTPTITCPAGQTASPVLINVSAWQFTSTKSTQDANLLARAYAQDQANRQAVCTQSNQIYARVEYAPESVDDYIADDYVYHNEYVTATLKFYSDAACTQPYILTENLSITGNSSGSMWDPSGISYGGYGISATALSGTTSVVLETEFPLFGYNEYYDENHELIYFERWTGFHQLSLGQSYSIRPPYYQGITLPVWY